MHTVGLFEFNIFSIIYLHIYVVFTGWRTSKEASLHASWYLKTLFWLPSSWYFHILLHAHGLCQAKLSKISTALSSTRWHFNGTPVAPVCLLWDWESLFRDHDGSQCQQHTRLNQKPLFFLPYVFSQVWILQCCQVWKVAAGNPGILQWKCRWVELVAVDQSFPPRGDCGNIVE